MRRFAQLSCLKGPVKNLRSGGRLVTALAIMLLGAIAETANPRPFQSPHLRMNQTFTMCVSIAYVINMAATSGQ
jgi:hypothetical protein